MHQNMSLQSQHAGCNSDSDSTNTNNIDVPTYLLRCVVHSPTVDTMWEVFNSSQVHVFKEAVLIG